MSSKTRYAFIFILYFHIARVITYKTDVEITLAITLSNDILLLKVFNAKNKHYCKTSYKNKIFIYWKRAEVYSISYISGNQTLPKKKTS